MLLNAGMFSAARSILHPEKKKIKKYVNTKRKISGQPA
jgi:hypothetical protein